MLHAVDSGHERRRAADSVYGVVLIYVDGPAVCDEIESHLDRVVRTLCRIHENDIEVRADIGAS